MRQLFPLAIVAVLCAVGCSKPGASNGAGASAQATPAAASVPAGNPCDRKLISQADVAPLLDEAISSEKAVDPQTCRFETTGFSSVSISLRPGLGDVSVDQIKSGATNQTVTPLAGVGERAVWDPTLKQVSATKNNVLCEIGAMGPATKNATSDKVGALCSKIFAAM
ncbi:MAG: hypothetical protein WDM85_09900 [Caulobacteraceae bacterium]